MNRVKDKKNKKYTALIISIMIVFLIIILAITGVFAYKEAYATNTTDMTGSVLATSPISEDNIGPVLDYLKDGVSGVVSVSNTQATNMNTTVTLKVTSISDTLKSESFKYAIVTSTDENFNNCSSVTTADYSDCTVSGKGDFSGVNQDDNLTLATNVTIPGSTTVFYKLIIYIDGTIENNHNLMEKNFTGTLNITDTTNALYTITLDNQNAISSGTSNIYVNYGAGIYLNRDLTNLMTTSSNPIEIPVKRYTITLNNNYDEAAAQTKAADWTFGGYYTQIDGGGEQIIANSGNLTNVAKITYFTTNQTIYAKWTGGTITLTTPERPGYEFEGWYTLPNGGTQVTASTVFEKDTTLYARWTRNKEEIVSYTINYLPNSGTGSMGSHTVNYGETVTIKANNFTKNGYTFAGWTTNPSGNDDGYGWTNWTGVWVYDTDQFGIYNYELNLYAKWVPNIYTISLDNAGATEAGTMNIYQTYETRYSLTSDSWTMTTTSNSITIPIKKGYIFDGYYTSENGNGTKYIDANGYLTSNANNTDFTSDGILYAKWNPKVITVTYNNNDGSGKTTTQQFTYGLENQTFNDAPTREDYTFMGWSLTADGEAEYQNNYSVTGSWIDENYPSITLYAKWIEGVGNTIFIYYNVNGGIIDTSTSGGSFGTNGSGVISKDGVYDFHQIVIGTTLGSGGLIDYNDESYVHVTKTGYEAVTNSEWNTAANGSGTSFSQSTEYSYDDLINYATADGNNYRLDLYINWEDKIPPTLPTIQTIYNLWGNKDYSISSSYSSNVGINGTWTTTNTDPSITFSDIGNIDNVKGAYIKLASSLSTDITVQVFYATSSGTFSESNSEKVTLKAGETELLIDFTEGNWKQIKFDVGEITGLQYQISNLGVIASDNQWNNGDILLNLTTTELGSGVNYWQYTYSDNATETGTNANTTWVTHSNSDSSNYISSPYSTERNATTYVRACDKSGNCSEKNSTEIKIEKTLPVSTISTTSTLKTNSQTATLSCTDTNGIISYYWGTDSNPSNGFTSITATNSFTIDKTVSNNGTYYFYCKDTAGNISAEASKTYYNYNVNNLLLNLGGTASTYTTNNYTSKSTATYLAPSGTTLTIASIATIPTGSSTEVMKGISLGAPSTTSASVSTTVPTLTGNNTYSIWFERNKVYIQYSVNGGTVTSPTTYYDEETVYHWTTDSSGVVKISYDGGTSYSYRRLSIDHEGTLTDTLTNYNNINYLNITKSGFQAEEGAHWICLEGCSVTSKTFDQYEPYDASDFCDTTTSNCTVTLGVNWENSNYSVVADPNKGTIPTTSGWTAVSNHDSAVKIVTYGSTYGTLPSPTRTGYRFGGWYNPIIKNTINLSADSSSNFKYDKTLDNIYPGVTYNVTMDSATLTSGTATNFSIVIFDFTDNATLTEKSVSFGNNISQSLTCPNNANSGHDIKLLIYSGQKASTAGNTTEFTNVKIGTTGLSNSTSTKYTTSSTVSTASNHTLYAAWNVNTYTVNYYNGSTKLGSSSHTYDTSKSLTTWATLGGSITNSSYGWTFAGWSTTNDFSVEYTNGQSVSNLTDTHEGTVNLYAVYSRTIRFYSGKSKATTSTTTQNWNPAGTTNGTNISGVTSPALTAISSWTASGFRNDTTAGSKEYNASATIYPAVAGGATLYGVYSRTYTANFYSGYNKATTGTKTSDTAYYNSNSSSTPTTVTITLSPSSPTNISNWTAQGWRNDTTASGAEYSNGASESVAWGTNFYRVYNRTLTISYNGNGSTSGSTSSTTKTIWLNSGNTSTSSQSVTLANNGFSKTNHTFSKWAVGSASGTQYTAGTSYNPSLAYNASTFGKTMYAVWTNNYTTYYVKTSSGNLNCRATPSGSGTLVDSYPCGTSFSGYESSTSGWVYYPSAGCYMSSTYLVTTKPTCTTTYYVTASSGLNCRASASGSATVVSTYSCGTIIAGEQASTSGWIYYPSGNCYLSSSYMSTSAPGCSTGGSTGGGGSSCSTISGACTCWRGTDIDNSLSYSCSQHGFKNSSACHNWCVQLFGSTAKSSSTCSCK